MALTRKKKLPAGASSSSSSLLPIGEYSTPALVIHTLYLQCSRTENCTYRLEPEKVCHNTVTPGVLQHYPSYSYSSLWVILLFMGRGGRNVSLFLEIKKKGAHFTFIDSFHDLESNRPSSSPFFRSLSPQLDKRRRKLERSQSSGQTHLVNSNRKKKWHQKNLQIYLIDTADRRRQKRERERDGGEKSLGYGNRSIASHDLCVMWKRDRESKGRS